MKGFERFGEVWRCLERFWRDLEDVWRDFEKLGEVLKGFERF